MKISLITAVGITTALLSACTSHNENAYTLTLPAPDGSDGKMAYITNFDTGKAIDSVLISGPEIRFEGIADTATWIRVFIGNDRQGSLILEPGILTRDSARNVKGGALNDIYQRFEAYTDSMMHIAEIINADTTSSATDRIADLENEYNAEKLQLLKANANNPIGYYIFLNDAYAYNPAQLDSALSEMPQMARYTRIQKLCELNNKRAKTMPGCKYIDFEVLQPGDSLPTRLSDYVGNGKYTLVDFWASWCGPCIRETKVIKDLYNQYAPLGLQILGVAVWDEPENTLAAIESHQLPWPQIINAQSIPTDIYGIPAIPCIILFAPDGTIISRDLQGDDLRRSVADAMENIK